MHCSTDTACLCQEQCCHQKPDLHKTHDVDTLILRQEQPILPSWGRRHEATGCPTLPSKSRALLLADVLASITCYPAQLTLIAALCNSCLLALVPLADFVCISICCFGFKPWSIACHGEDITLRSLEAVLPSPTISSSFVRLIQHFNSTFPLINTKLLKPRK
jgi:hypothetical protein